MNRGALSRIGLLALIWGSSFLWIKLADRDFSAVEVTLGRLAAGAAVLNYQIISSDGATVASTVTYLLPVIAIVLGVLVLHETVTALTLAGIALVLAGVALTRRPAAARHRDGDAATEKAQAGK